MKPHTQSKPEKMQATFGGPAVKETCDYKPVDIKIEDLFTLNWNHWKVGYEQHNSQIDNPEYYIYSILGGIVFMRFNEENQLAVKHFVEKQPESRFNKAYLAWYDIKHDPMHKPSRGFNTVKEAKVPNFSFDVERLAKTIDAELSDPKSLYPDTTFDDIAERFVADVKAALEANDPEKIRKTHNVFTSIMINHIIKKKVPGPIFVYQKRDIPVKQEDGTTKTVSRICDEIHFIVTKETSIRGKVKVENKTMPTLPMITGGGRHRSSWTIEKMLIKGNIIGLMETELVKRE